MKLTGIILPSKTLKFPPLPVKLYQQAIQLTVTNVYEIDLQLIFFSRWQKLTPCLLANSGEVQTHNTASNILVRFASCRKGYCSVLGRVTRWDKGTVYPIFSVFI